jgi:hypothetical protein
MVIMPIPHHTATKSRGEPSDLAMAAGVRKMPSAMDSPVTTATVLANPICLRCSIEATSYADSNVAGIHRMVEMTAICLCVNRAYADQKMEKCIDHPGHDKFGGDSYRWPLRPTSD